MNDDDGARARGFAAMSPEVQREIARRGGRAAHARGTAHKWSSDEARAAGKKGGATVSSDRGHMSAIGKLGGAERGRRMRGTSTTHAERVARELGTDEEREELAPATERGT